MFLSKGLDMKIILVLLVVMVGCSSPQKSYNGKKFSSSFPVEKYIHRGSSNYTMNYREINSGHVKKVYAYYNAKEIENCFLLVKEKYVFSNLSRKLKKVVLNTYQVPLQDIDLSKVRVVRESHAQRKQIKFISGDADVYALNLEMNYKKNSLMPHTQVALDNGHIDSSKVKLLPKMSIRFSNSRNATLARDQIWRKIGLCSRN